MTEWIVLSPRHGFFAKDGRGWNAGGTNLGRGLDWPRPTTVRGAICTAIGLGMEARGNGPKSPKDWLHLKGEVRLRSTLAVRRPVETATACAEHLMWPAPADALHVHGRDKPRRLGWWQRPAEMQLIDRAGDPWLRALWFAAPVDAAKPRSGPPWWTHEEMVGWLTGQASLGAPVGADARRPERRADVHVKLDYALGTADPGMLWANEVHETLVRDNSGGGVHRWEIAARLDLIGGAASQARWPATATLAGDRRLASVTATSDLCPAPPRLLQAVEASPPRRLRLYAVTPALFTDGFYPDGFTLAMPNRLSGASLNGVGPLVLVGAMVSRAIPISGWAMDGSAGGLPGDLFWAAPPGAVYAVEKSDGQPFGPDEVSALWLAQWGTRQDDGFGVVIPGMDGTNGPVAR